MSKKLLFILAGLGLALGIFYVVWGFESVTNSLVSVDPADYEDTATYEAAIQAKSLRATERPLPVRVRNALVTIPQGWKAYVLVRSDGSETLYLEPLDRPDGSPRLSVFAALFLSPQESEKGPITVSELESEGSKLPNTRRSKRVLIEGREWFVREVESGTDKKQLSFSMKSPAREGFYAAAASMPSELEGVYRKSVEDIFQSLKLSF